METEGVLTCKVYSTPNINNCNVSSATANSDFECNRNQNIQFSSQDSDNQQQQQQQQQPQPQPQPQQEQEQQDYNQQFSSSETTSQLHDPEYTAEDSFSKASFEIPIFHIPGVHNDLPLPSMIPGSSVLSDLKYPTISGSNSFVIPEDELYPIRSTQREEEASPTSEPVIQNKRRRTKRYSKISDDPQFKVPNEALVRSLREFIRMKNMKQRAVAHALSVSPSTLCKYMQGESRKRGWANLEQRISDWLYEAQQSQPLTFQIFNAPPSPN